MYVSERHETDSDDKAQIHTLEGFTAAFIIVFALLFSVQAIGITPTSSSTASQAVELHNYKMVDDVLSQSKANGELKASMLYWNETDARFGESLEDREHYSGRLGNTVPDVGENEDGTGDFGETLQSLHRRGIAHNIHIVCDGSEHRFVYNGQPSTHAVTASVTVQLYDQDTVKLENGGDKKLSEVDNYHCSNISEDTDLHSVAEVRITAWRM